jgi:hypothetical protein
VARRKAGAFSNGHEPDTSNFLLFRAFPGATKIDPHEAISIVTPREFAAEILDPVALNEFESPFRVVQLSRMIAWWTALLQTSLSRRLGENDAWIAGTAIAYGATLVGRERAFSRVPRLDYLTFQRWLTTAP